MIESSGQMSPRELQEHDWRMAEFERQAEHAISMKKLELELQKEQHDSEIELKRLESVWAIWLKIPLVIIKLPVYVLLGFGYIIGVAFKYQHPKAFWDLMK